MKNPERGPGGGEEAGGVEERPGARDGGEGAEEGDIERADGGVTGLETRVGRERAALAERGPDGTVEVYMSEESEEGVTVVWQEGHLQE